MSNLKNPVAIWTKGALFVVLGLFASVILVLRNPDIMTAVLVAIAVWAFCRAYYFAFYVIERYIDPTFRFSGLIDFARYAILGKTPDRSEFVNESVSADLERDHDD